MFQSLEDLDFPERSNGHAFLLIMHENPLERNKCTISFVNSLVHLSAENCSQKNNRKKEKRKYPKVPSPSFVVAS